MFNNIAESELQFVLEQIKDKYPQIVLQIKEVRELFNPLLFKQYQENRQIKQEIYMYGNSEHIKRNEHKKTSIISYLHSSIDSVEVDPGETNDLLVCRCTSSNILPLFVIDFGVLISNV